MGRLSFHALWQFCRVGEVARGRERVGLYSSLMAVSTSTSAHLRDRLAKRSGEVAAVLHRYSARNPRLFGSVARGDATPQSDIDLLVELDSGAGNELLRVAGISEELSDLLRVRVDVVAEALMRDDVSATAFADAVAL